MMRRSVYRPQASLSAAQQEFVWRAYGRAKYAALEAAKKGHVYSARHDAQEAREIIAAFGVRGDRRRVARLPEVSAFRISVTDPRMRIVGKTATALAIAGAHTE